MSLNTQMIKQTVVHLYHGILFSNKDVVCMYWYIQQLDKSLESFADWEKANPKRLHRIRRHFYNVLKWQNRRNREWISSHQGLRSLGLERSENGHEGRQEGSLDGWKDSASHLINIKQEFGKTLPWGKPSEGYTGSFCITSYSCMWTYNYLEIQISVKK